MRSQRLAYQRPDPERRQTHSLIQGSSYPAIEPISDGRDNEDNRRSDARIGSSQVESTYHQRDTQNSQEGQYVREIPAQRFSKIIALRCVDGRR